MFHNDSMNRVNMSVIHLRLCRPPLSSLQSCHRPECGQTQTRLASRCGRRETGFLPGRGRIACKCLKSSHEFWSERITTIWQTNWNYAKLLYIVWKLKVKQWGTKDSTKVLVDLPLPAAIIVDTYKAVSQTWVHQMQCERMWWQTNWNCRSHLT